MAILRNDSGFLAITDNTGKPLLRTVGSIINSAYGQTTVETTVNSPIGWVATDLSASIPVSASTSQIIIIAFTMKNYTTSYSSLNLDFMCTGGVFNQTILSGHDFGFASAAGGQDENLNYLRGVSLHFVHAHGQPVGTSLTYTLAGEGRGGVNGRNNLYKSTIQLMEVV